MQFRHRITCLIVQDESEPGRGGDRKVEMRVWSVLLVVGGEDLHLVSGLGQEPKGRCNVTIHTGKEREAHGNETGSVARMLNIRQTRIEGRGCIYITCTQAISTQEKDKVRTEVNKS